MNRYQRKTYQRRLWTAARSRFLTSRFTYCSSDAPCFCFHYRVREPRDPIVKSLPPILQARPPEQPAKLHEPARFSAGKIIVTRSSIGLLRLLSFERLYCHFSSEYFRGTMREISTPSIEGTFESDDRENARHSSTLRSVPFWRDKIFT